MLSFDLQEKIQLYLNLEISLSELEEWIVPRMHQFMANPYSKDADFVAIIEQGLAEMSDNLIDESLLRNLLNDAINEMNISFNLEESVVAGTASETSKNKVLHSLNDLIFQSFPLEPSGI